MVHEKKRRKEEEYEQQYNLQPAQEVTYLCNNGMGYKQLGFPILLPYYRLRLLVVVVAYCCCYYCTLCPCCCLLLFLLLPPCSMLLLMLHAIQPLTNIDTFVSFCRCLVHK